MPLTFLRAMTDGSTMADFEFQFTEGFTGQTVTLVVDAEPRAEFLARTKLMTGLANIMPLSLPDGKEVTLRVADASRPETKPVSVTVTVDATTPFYVIAWQDGALDVTSTARRPGYL
ncbi:hypothetical protein [Aestuariicoccus sp. MJ-SS9]|uniref:hypothetical protein n=1 Tax=Aestuariicoccus sp. MJ-SS9 TaxID=3079855 RepID=UPI00292D076A|nr:hypothetical protein [Aestuariicoccus sp. MJ-SS9]